MNEQAPELTADAAFDACTPGDTEAALTALRRILSEDGAITGRALHHLAQMNPQVDLYDVAARLYDEMGIAQPVDDWEAFDASKVGL